MKKRGDKITMITSYDACTAEIVDEAGIEIILVGDSLGNVIQGEKDTLSVTMEEMIYHTLILENFETIRLNNSFSYLCYS